MVLIKSKLRAHQQVLALKKNSTNYNKTEDDYINVPERLVGQLLSHLIAQDLQTTSAHLIQRSSNPEGNGAQTQDGHTQIK